MIVKNLLVVGVVAGFATAAAAAEEGKSNFKVGAKVRMDNVQSTTETTNAGSAKTTEKSSAISLNRAQFDLTGTHGSDTLYVKYYAESNYLRTATVTHKFSDMISATFGKMQMLAQSYETDYSSTDMYLYSAANMVGIKGTDSSGAKIGLSFGDHSLAIQALQGLSTVEDATFKSSGGLTTAIQYRGNINNMIRPLISYTMVRTSGSTTTADSKTAANYGDGYQTQMGAGVQVDAAGATVDLELDTVKNHKQKGSTGKDSNVQSIIAQVKYPVGMTTPFIKFVSDSAKYGAAQDVGDMARTAMAVGVEHKLDSSCRLHAVYTSDNSTTKAGTAGDNKVAETGFNIGVTAAM